MNQLHRPRALIAFSSLGTGCALGILAFGLNNDSATITTAAVTVLAGVCMALFWKDRRNSFATLAFTACYCLFLLSRQAINIIVGTPSDEDGVLGTGAASTDVLNSANIVLFIGLCGLLAGWAISTRSSTDGRSSIDDAKRSVQWDDSARRIAIPIFLATTPVRIYLIWSTAASVTETGFYDARLTTAVPLPLRVLEALFHVSFFAILAARPTRKLVGQTCALYVAVAALSLFTLARNEFLLSVVVVALYLYYRQAYLHEKWFSPKRITGLVAASPLLLALLNEVGSRRGRGPGSSTGALSPLIDFFRSQGVSIKVPVYTEELSPFMPTEKFYSVGPIIEFFQRIESALSGAPTQSLQGQTAERAVDGHQLAHTISYLISPSDYLRGTGYGSSFVSELNVDFGLLGVAIGAGLYGVLLTRSAHALQGSFTATLVTLMLLKGAMFVPRASFVQPLVDTFALPSLVAIGMLYGLVQLAYTGSRKGDQRQRTQRSARAKSSV